LNLKVKFGNTNLFLPLYFRFLNDTEIAKAQRDFELKKAAYDVEVHTKVNTYKFINSLAYEIKRCAFLMISIKFSYFLRFETLQ
jgi:hypothetical protein